MTRSTGDGAAVGTDSAGLAETRRELLRSAGAVTAGLMGLHVMGGNAFAGIQAQGGGAELKHPNVLLVERYYATYAQGDPQALRPFFAEDIVWRIPGHHSLWGERPGVEYVLAFFAQPAKAGFLAEPIARCAGGE